MKFLVFLAVFAPTSVLAAAPTSLSQIAIDHLKDASGLKLTSVGDRTLIAVQAPEGDDKGAFWYGVDPGMDAATARVVWTSRVACPLPTVGEVLATPSLVLCRTDHDVFALAPQDGGVRWRFRHKKPLALMATVGERVAVNVDNEELVVLELATGRVLRRFALLGAPLQAVGESPNGPLALIVAKAADGAPAGQTHEIVAQPLSDAASTTNAQLEPLAPLWRTPFGGADYRLVPSQTTVVATPVPGVIDARDLATGKVLWAEPVPLLPTLEPLTDGLAVGGIRPDGLRWVGIANTRTKITVWRRAWPFGALHGVGLDNGHVVFLGDGGWLVARAKDGQLEATGEVSDAGEVIAVQAADHVLTLLTSQGRAGATWQQVALSPTEAPPPLPPPPPVDWLAAGRQLQFLDFPHGGRDPRTLLPGDGAMLAVTVWPLKSAQGWAFEFRRQDAKGEGQNGTRTMTAEALESAARFDLDLAAAGAAVANRTALRLSKGLWRALLDTGRAELTLDGAQLALHLDGLASTRLQVRDEAGVFHWADVDVQVASNEDGSVRLWLLPYGDAAIAARAELPHLTWALMSVDWRPHGAAEPTSADGNAPPKSKKLKLHKKN